MKAIKKKALSGILVIMLLLMFAPLASAATKTYKWRIQGIIGAAGRHWIEHYAETVDKVTMGRIKIKVFTADQLVPSTEMLNAVKDGVLDMACTIPGMHAPPITTGVALSGPIFGMNSDIEAAAFRETFKGGRAFEIMREEFAENGVYAIAPEYEGALGLLTKKPLRTIADLKGLKPEALVPDIAIFLKHLGVASQFVPPEEVYLALSTGTINASTIGNAFVFKDLGLDEVAHYLHKPYLVYGAAPVYIINLKIWNKLPKDLQIGLETATLVHTKWMAEQMYIDNVEAEATGRFEIVELSDELKEAMWVAAVKSWDEAAKMGPRAAEVVELLKEWNRLHGHIK